MTLHADHETRPIDDGASLVRRRLLSALDRAARRPITLVAAPTGYGKTTLLHHWLQEHPEALSLEGSRPRAWQQAAQALRAGRPVVVDDGHLAGWGPAFEAACTVADSSAPLVVASRVDPLLALHRERLAGRVSEIRADQLAFSVGELTRVVASAGRRLDQAEAAAMHRDTDGWPAGVRLSAARSSHDLADDGAYSPSGSYLLSHVVANLDPSLRAFLLDTAVPEEFDVSLAHRLSGRTDASDLLRELAYAVGFVARNDKTGLFRYHPMLRHLLLSELEREPVSRLRALHDTAGRWTFARDLLDASAGHAVRAHDDDLASDVAIALACRSLGDGDWSALDALTDRLPVVFARDDERGRLLLALRAIRDDDIEGAVAALGHTARRTSLDVSTHERVVTLTALCRGWLALAEGDTEAAREWIAGADPVVDLGAGSPTAGLRCGWVLVHSALALADGRLEALDDLERGAARLAAHAPVAAVTAAEIQMWRAFATGRLADAEQAVTTIEQHTGGQPLMSVVVVRRWIERERAQPASTVPEPARPDDHPNMLPPPLLDALLVQLTQDPPSTYEAAARCERATSWLLARRALLDTVTSLLVSGETARATRTVETTCLAHPALDPSPYLLWIALTDALCTGDREAGAPLTELIDLGLDVPEDLRVRILLAAAALELAAGDLTAASARLRPALESTTRHGWRRPWVALGTAAFDLLRAERGRVGPYGDLVTRLLVELRQDHDVSVDLVVALSARELEILQYLPTSLDQVELCASLFISRNTLKTHLRAIYRKLGVESRREAVLKAQRIGLL
ncbi:LuxR C-terminal-related transcriptional regulator [Mumia quercus]|uniref:LuxR C-terminal-related transcriptional regulator n=1 Tax=Mumia quercus TaxID=2976125 RepID=UPI0021CE62E8|nr:LuxR C-terminal-related transcriptional regulator [Mumia quercus]